MIFVGLKSVLQKKLVEEQKAQLLEFISVRNNKDETIAGLQHTLKGKDLELAQVKEESVEKCDLLAAQLRQVEKELRHYFELSRNQDKAIQSFIALQKRSSSIMARMMP